MKKGIAVFSLVLCLLFFTTGCDNSAARPSTEYANIRDFLTQYEDKEFATNTEFAGTFVRNLAGLVMKQDDTAAFADWTVSAQTEEGVIVYSKETRLFGYPATVNVGFEKKQTKVGAISLILQSGDKETDYKISSWFYKGLLDKVSKPTQAYIDGAEKTSKEAEDLIAAYDSSHSITATWPKSSVKWSCMVQYQLDENGNTFVGVYAK